MDEITKLPLGGWIFYFNGKEKRLDKHKCGKWMHFFNQDFAAHICEEAIMQNICVEAKHTQTQRKEYAVFI